MRKFFYLLLLSALLFSCNNGVKSDSEPKLKYIFFFIGDGMGNNHVSLTEAYLQSIRNDDDTIGFNSLIMSKLGSFGMCKTHCRNRLITDSGAAGSALACGRKFDHDVISYLVGDSLPNHDAMSIAELAKNEGMRVGIITTVSLNNATPAVYYASTANRNNYADIADQLFASDFDLFAGGGIYCSNNDKPHVDSLITANKSDIIGTLSPISNNDKSIFISPVTTVEESLPYAIDREEQGGVTLPELVEAGIARLDGDSGFFMMVEGGKIDWAAHANDAAAVVHDVIDLDNAVGVACDFAEKHPLETLIIVTADHETGGLSIGNNSSGYNTRLQLLQRQKISSELFAENLDNYKHAHGDDYRLTDIINLADSVFYSGLDLTANELQQVQLACDVDYAKVEMTASDRKLLYGGYNPIATTFVKIVDKRAGVGFTTFKHTAAPVPVFCKGSNDFSGLIDNTDFFHIIKNMLRNDQNSNQR